MTGITAARGKPPGSEGDLDGGRHWALHIGLPSGRLRLENMTLSSPSVPTFDVYFENWCFMLRH